MYLTQFGGDFQRALHTMTFSQILTLLQVRSNREKKQYEAQQKANEEPEYDTKDVSKLPTLNDVARLMGGAK